MNKKSSQAIILTTAFKQWIIFSQIGSNIVLIIFYLDWFEFVLLKVECVVWLSNLAAVVIYQFIHLQAGLLSKWFLVINKTTICLTDFYMICHTKDALTGWLCNEVIDGPNEKRCIFVAEFNNLLLSKANIKI